MFLASDSVHGRIFIAVCCLSLPTNGKTALSPPADERRRPLCCREWNRNWIGSDVDKLPFVIVLAKQHCAMFGHTSHEASAAQILLSFPFHPLCLRACLLLGNFSTSTLSIEIFVAAILSKRCWENARILQKNIQNLIPLMFVACQHRSFKI